MRARTSMEPSADSAQAQAQALQSLQELFKFSQKLVSGMADLSQQQNTVKIWHLGSELFVLC